MSKLTERIAELKSQLMNVKDEQDFNINQLIKHRNDLKLKMEKMKDDMENGLIDDKEKLKFLSLIGNRVCKVGLFIKKEAREPSSNFLHLICFHHIATSNSFKARQNHHSTDSSLRKSRIGPSKNVRHDRQKEKISRL